MGNLKEEKKQILKMLEEGKITSEEGINLLEALENTAGEEHTLNTGKPKWIKIKVFEPNDKAKVNVTIPISLVDVGLKIANKFSPDLKESGLDENDLNEIYASIKSGTCGKIVDIESDNGEKVEIVIE